MSAKRRKKSKVRAKKGDTATTTDTGKNYVSGGIEENGALFALAIAGPFLTIFLGYLTSKEFKVASQDYLVTPEHEVDGWLEEATITTMKPHLSSMLPICYSDLSRCGTNLINILIGSVCGPSQCFDAPHMRALQFLFCFMSVALVLDACLPGKTETGPETGSGHVPKYVDNGLLHCFTYSVLYYLGSNLSPVEALQMYDFGIIYDTFPYAIGYLNVFGILFCIFLTFKGIYYPSTEDSGSSGSKVKDFLWGTELYPRLGWLDLKRFINCRFSMTFWQLAGLSFVYKSLYYHADPVIFTRSYWSGEHSGGSCDLTGISGDSNWFPDECVANGGTFKLFIVDWGLIFSAISQYLYLVKFFLWEMGYMRSIDIIVDRAGFEIQWGCLCFVPAAYTLCTRFLVQNPSGLSFVPALVLFLISIISVYFNYMADKERDVFRATGGKELVWGKPAEYIEAKYTIVDAKTGKTIQKTSLLLYSGYWGQARHLQYLFELMAAWSWCLLANPFVNGVIPLFYCIFLTYLLIDRADRDSKKCLLKYGKYYEEYKRRVPYKIIPGIW